MLLVDVRRGLWSLLLAATWQGSVTQGSPAYGHPPKGEPISSVVDLGYAKYKGTTLEAGVNQYLGMRYAAPPLGDLRWRAPQDPPHVKGVQDATEFQATCLGLFGPGLSNTTNEDCLYISVHAPSNATTKSKLPVWFFIQGGGYAGNTDQNFNGTEVVKQSGNNMVFVQLNYRVGAFGFLASKKIRQNGDLNAGLLDQRKALHWVQKYIHLFGGDPDHVVIHGDSAGAGSVAFHLAAYGGRDDGLFVGAISESPFVPTHRTVRESEFQFDRFAKQVKCGNAHDKLKCIRSKDTATLQSADVVSAFPGGPKHVLPAWYFLPVVDGTFSKDLLYRQLEQGRIHKVPTIVGDDNDEGTGFSPNATSPEQFLDFIQANYPHLNQLELLLIRAAYPPGKIFPNHAKWFTPAEEAYGEVTFICPGIEFSRSIASYLSPDKSWNYRYNVEEAPAIAAGLGVPHVAEKPAIFGPGNAGLCGDPCSYEEYNAPMVPIVMNYWISFIRSLNPNTYKHSTAPEWKPWGRGLGLRLKFELDDTKMEQVPLDQQARCLLWKHLAPVSEQ